MKINLNTYNVILLLLLGNILFANVHTQAYSDMVVAKDGSGDYVSLTEAIDVLPMYTYERVVIYVKNGTYNEKIRIEQNHISIIGENRKKTIIQYNQPRSAWLENKDPIGPAVINIHADDFLLQNLTVKNTQPLKNTHAFAIYGTGTRTVFDNCDITSNGGDTLSLWNYKDGMYYHSNCYFEGGVDFVCPRGWCYIKDSKFFENSKTAAIWHAGTINEKQKFVLENCDFDGVEGYNLARHHYEAQFYLIDCNFSETMVDKPIEHVVYTQKPEKNRPYFWGDRYYYHNCSREGSEYEWFDDNLSIKGIDSSDISAYWTFDRKWNPEDRSNVKLDAWDLIGQDLYLYFDENMTIRDEVVLETQTGEKFQFAEGRGRKILKFKSDSSIDRKDVLDGLKITNGEILGSTATVNERKVSDFLKLHGKNKGAYTIFLIGDSTMAEKKEKRRPETGWGEMLYKYFEPTVRIENHAKNGRSSRSFIAENRWEDVVNQLEENDFVFIQFGHNDTKKDERFSSPEEYGINLLKFITETRAKNAIPVLFTPVVRRRFDEHGKYYDTHGDYPNVVRELAKKHNVTLIDLHKLSENLLIEKGEQESKKLYLILEPNESENYPEGKLDNTHFSTYGATTLASIVAEKLRTTDLELKDSIIK